MARINVAVINDSTVPDHEVERARDVLAQQVNNDFARAWGITADLRFVGRDDRPPEGHWWLVILDESDRGEDLGYHDLNDEGLPIAKVFAKTDEALGYEWTMTASHELLEMLADPGANLTAFVRTAYGDFMYAYEICDPCEAKVYSYVIDGIRVSDFVFPTWFEAAREFRIGNGPAERFDKEAHVVAPLQMLPGCHIDVYDPYPCAWRTFWGEGLPYRYEARPGRGTRRERRRLASSRRRRSDVIRMREEALRAPDAISDLRPGTLQELSSSLLRLADVITRTRRGIAF